MLSIGLTGGVATGKSHVRAQMAALGWSTIDADRLAREVVRPGQPAWREIRDRFGDAVCGTASVLNRQALGSIVFSDADARKDLEAIVHTGLISRILERVPGVYVRRNGPGSAVAMSMRGAGRQGRCRLQVYVDGVRTSQDHDLFRPEEIEAMEIYRGISTPMQYLGNGCGAVLLWTRR